jgi:hypothetical protein
MASAFWTLEDGRGFARRWAHMAYMLKLITDELRAIDGAKEFFDYLEKFVYREEAGDIYNGYGGFIRGDENIMFDLDLRTFAPLNRQYFWRAAQMALRNLKITSPNKDDIIVFMMTELLDMHKRIERKEDPFRLNHMRTIEPGTNEKLGPGW